jgi:hypothetical protein
MDNSDVQSLQALTVGWSTEEELVIAKIQQTESVPRPEAIQRMQRRKKLSPLDAALTLKRSTRPAPDRLCRNPRCTGGDDHRPGSLAHLRGDALYCNAACKRPVREVSDARIGLQIVNVYAGLRGTNSAPCYHPLSKPIEALKSPAIEYLNRQLERTNRILL